MYIKGLFSSTVCIFSFQGLIGLPGFNGHNGLPVSKYTKFKM